MTDRAMTVAVDGRLVFDEVRRGIAKTTIGLYRALSIGRPRWKFVVFYREGINDNPFADCPNIELRKIDFRGDRFRLWDRVRLPWAIWRSRADLFHSHSGVAPPHPMTRMVVTIHDLIPLDCRADEPNVQEWRDNLARSAKNARFIITASEHAKERIVHHFRVPPEKIRIVPWAPFSQAENVIAQGEVGMPYALHFGMSDVRKNTVRVLDAWCGLPAEVRAVNRLKIVGLDLKGLEAFRQRTLDESIEFRGYVEEVELRRLLSGARFLVYPTLYEGFGMPILDAFAAGVPVLTSSTTSLPEVAGDAAEYVDPNDTDSMAAGLLKLLTDPERRLQLTAMGHARVARYTWETTAEKVAAIFEEAVAR